MKIYNILIVDDHPMMRTAIRFVIEDQPGLKVAGEAGSIKEGRQAALAFRPDLILLDLYLPDGSGMDMIRFRNEQLPKVKILVLTSSNNEQDITDAVKAGADGYVVKDSPPEQLILAVRSILAGRAFLTPVATNILLKQLRADGVKPQDNDLQLSDRELEIMKILARGATNSVIAEELKIAESTVRSHFQRIQKKLGFTNHNQTLIYAVQNYTKG